MENYLPYILTLRDTTLRGDSGGKMDHQPVVDQKISWQEDFDKTISQYGHLSQQLLS